MIRKAFLMQVKPAAHDEYEKRHDEIWSELTAVLKKHGVNNYSIFLDAEKHQLFGYVEIESEDEWNAIADTDVCKEWWVYMKDIMPSNPDNSPVSKELKTVFHLS